jgi:hypothetical protein
MIYAQINQNVIVNVVDIEDPTLIPLFAEGFDLFLRIDNLPIVPVMGWVYNPITCEFSAPLSQSQSMVNDCATLGNQIILQWNAMNLIGDIYGADQTIAFLAYISGLYQLLSLGYLNDANDAITVMINDISPAKTALYPFLTNDILYAFQNQIQQFLITLPSIGN